MPKKTMWELIVEHSMPPTRTVRYCCEALKEQSAPNSFVATGVRADESLQRSSRKAFESLGSRKSGRVGRNLADMQENFESSVKLESVLDEYENQVNAYDCHIVASAKKNKDLIVNPIINFTESEIWQYIRDNHIKVCDLYFKGYRRVGCLGCPMGGRKSQMREFAEYPTYKRAYIRAFDKMLHNGKEYNAWKNAQEVFDWWTENPTIPGQISFVDDDGNFKNFTDYD